VRALSFLCLAPGLLLAQAPRIGVIDFYGLRHVTEKQLRNALRVREGDPIPPSKGAVEERLERVSGVFRARLEAVCCQGEGAILYVGIEERGAPHFEFHPAPTGDASLPEPILDSYRGFLAAVERAVRAGPVSDNIAQGYALSSDPIARAYQEGFRMQAAAHLDVLRQVLQDSADASQRACAAYIIGYAPAKPALVNDLQYAMQDPNESVRANAAGSLTALAALAARESKYGIRVEPTWFIEMLNSLVRSDRTRAANALVALTEDRNPYALDQIRDRALDSLAEMARWKTLDQALPAFIVLGRVADIPEKQIQADWRKGNRDAVIEKALKLHK
jgi:hypothetical protein